MFESYVMTRHASFSETCWSCRMLSLYIFVNDVFVGLGVSDHVPWTRRNESNVFGMLHMTTISNECNILQAELHVPYRPREYSVWLKVWRCRRVKSKNGIGRQSLDRAACPTVWCITYSAELGFQTMYFGCFHRVNSRRRIYYRVTDVELGDRAIKYRISHIVSPRQITLICT